MKKCDIIIPIWNQLQFTRSCLEAIFENTTFPHRLILIDNGSNAETRDYLVGIRERHPARVRLITNDKNRGFVKAVNQGLRSSKEAYICILNNDTVPARGWLAELVNFAQRHPDVGLLNPLCNGHIERKLTINDYAGLIAGSNKEKRMEMNQCQGFCLLMKKTLIEKIGYLDEAFGVGGFDDTDYSMRAHRAGYKSVCVYSSYVYHREHESFKKLGDRKKIQGVSERHILKSGRDIDASLWYFQHQLTQEIKR